VLASLVKFIFVLFKEGEELLYGLKTQTHALRNKLCGTLLPKNGLYLKIHDVWDVKKLLVKFLDLSFLLLMQDVERQEHVLIEGLVAALEHVVNNLANQLQIVFRLSFDLI
jgi:hypothetical protein